MPQLTCCMPHLSRWLIVKKARRSARRAGHLARRCVLRTCCRSRPARRTGPLPEDGQTLFLSHVACRTSDRGRCQVGQGHCRMGHRALPDEPGGVAGWAKGHAEWTRRRCQSQQMGRVVLPDGPGGIAGAALRSRGRHEHARGRARALDELGPAVGRLRQVDRAPHLVLNMRHATCNMRRATCDMQQFSCNTRHATRGMRHATNSMQHMTGCMLQVTGHRLHVTVHSPRPPNSEDMLHVAC